MLKPDYDAVAEMFAERARLREGDQVLIQAHDEGTPLTEAMTLACFRRGAVPLTLIAQEETQARVFREISAENVARPPAHLAALLEKTDVIFYLYSQNKNPAILADVPAAKLAAAMRGRTAAREVTYDGRRRVIIADFPTRAQADFFGVDFESYHDAFWSALDVDYGALGRRVGAVAKLIRGSAEVRVTTAKGTDVRLNVKGRLVQEDNGTISLPGEPDADVILNLPTGEACLAPAESGADGKAVFDFAFIGGRRVRDLEVRFERGRARLAGAAEGFDRAREYFAAGTGDPYLIAELGVGANPALTAPCGSILMDEKITGTVHLALGDNRSLGGANVSSIHQDMIILNPRVTCDGTLLMAEGQLKV